MTGAFTSPTVTRSARDRVTVRVVDHELRYTHVTMPRRETGAERMAAIVGHMLAGRYAPRRPTGA